MKIRHLIILLLLSSANLSSQNSVFSAGVRLGGQTWLPTLNNEVDGSIKGSIGAHEMVDFRYAYYGKINKHTRVGIMFGAGFGYGSCGVRGNNTDNFSNTDYSSNKIDYAATTDFKQSEQFANADFSLLLALRHNGFVAQIGPRLILPFSVKRTLRINDASIDAYYKQYDVHVVNEIITGKLETPYDITDKTQKWNVITLAIEMGWEWKLGYRSPNSVGIQAYANIGSRNGKTPAYSRLINVSPISNPSDPIPDVTVGWADSLISKRAYLDFGLRMYYAFSPNTSSSLKFFKRDRYRHRR